MSRSSDNPEDADSEDLEIVVKDYSSVLESIKKLEAKRHLPKFSKEEKDELQRLRNFERLARGRNTWNQWRANDLKHAKRMPNLTGAKFGNVFMMKVNFEGVDLSRADFSGADLSEANLSNSKIRNANLDSAYLEKANLANADFSGSFFASAELTESNLQGASLTDAFLGTANFTGADLRGANFSDADIAFANFSRADLRGADFSRTTLENANFTKSDLRGANLCGADLTRASLSALDLTGANLRLAKMIETNLEGTNLSNCSIYGISAWNLGLKGATQANLNISRENEPILEVDNIEVGQFIYLMLNNEKIRGIIDTLTSKVVLILGRFTPERKPILDALREQLRIHNYSPVLFDFEGPSSRDLTETVSILAHMARFVIADITDARSIPQELQTIVPNLPSVPILIMLESSQREYALFEHFKSYPWVLETYTYKNPEEVLASLDIKVIGPAEAKVKELRGLLK